MYKCIYKRLFDIILSSIGIIISSPILLLVWGLLLVANKSDGVFFLQNRPGKGGKIFRVIKFKTMTDKRNSDGQPLPDFKRLTSIGKVIRTLSIDELPQLFNVFCGDMSIVGPRPLLTSYLPLYSAKQFRRHDVKPGITGWAQVNGRNAITWEQKFDYDIYYVENISFIFDIKILFLTAKKVIYREGINASNTITMEPFKGSKIFE